MGRRSITTCARSIKTKQLAGSDLCMYLTFKHFTVQMTPKTALTRRLKLADSFQNKFFKSGRSAFENIAYFGVCIEFA